MKKEKCLNDFMVIKQVADGAGMSVVAVHKAISAERLRAVRKGRQWLVHKDEFERFRKECAS